jgi:NADPH:quinone reductase-like Zn-dependent oxidoreductase
LGVRPEDFRLAAIFAALAGPARLAAVRIVGFISPVPEETKGEDLAILAELVADGRLRPRIGLTLGWEKTAEAFAALSRREVRGKAVLTI